MQYSWAYAIQAARKNPMIYSVPRGTFVLGNHPYRDALVVPTVFSDDMATMGSIARNIVKATGRSMVLKNIAEGDVPDLLAEGFSRYGPGECWHEDAPLDDQTYPQRILVLQDLHDRRGKSYDQVRQDLNKFSRQAVELSFRLYDESRDRPEVENLLHAQDQRNPGTGDAHEPFLDLRPSAKTLPVTVLASGRLVAYSLVDEISSEYAAWNAVVYHTDITCLSTRILLEMACLAERRGYRYLNLQGSETSSLDRWKKKFNPTLSLPKTHLIYRA